MKSAKSRYNYDPSQPLSKQYQDAQVFNAYYKCFDTQTNNHYLLSHFKSENKTQVASLFKKFINIKQKLQGTTNKHLSTIHDVFMQNKDKSLFMVIDLSEGGSIMDYIGKVYTLDSQTAIRVILGALNGLLELHKHDIVNCFINLENIQLDQNGTPKLGFKCMIYKTIYLSPEFRKDHVKSKQTDLYCLGVCLYRLVYGQFPFKTQKTQQLVDMVKKGPVLQMLRGEGNFAIVGSSEVRLIIKDLLSMQGLRRFEGIKKLQTFSRQLSPAVTLNGEAYSKLFKSKYINIFTEVNDPDQSQYVVVDPKQKKLLKVLVFQGEKSQIEDYIKNVVNKYGKLSGESYLKIYEYQMLVENHLAIVFTYCGEGTLIQYKQNMEPPRSFSTKQVENSIQFLTSALQSLSSPHQYLTNESLCIKNGTLRIKFPQFKTKAFIQLLNKLSVNPSSSFIAPQILSGKQSPNCDSWSIGVLEYWMTFNQMPKFDSKDTLIVNKNQKLPKQKLLYFHNIIEINPNNRLDLMNENQLKNKLSNYPEPFNQFLSPNQNNDKRNPNDKNNQNVKKSQNNDILNSNKNLNENKNSKDKNNQNNDKNDSPNAKSKITSNKNVQSPKHKSNSKKSLQPQQDIQNLQKKTSEKLTNSKLAQKFAHPNNSLNEIEIDEPLNSKYKNPIIVSSSSPLPKKNPNKFSMKVFDDTEQIKSPQKIEAKEKQIIQISESAPPFAQQVLQYVLNIGGRLSTLQKSYTKSLRISIKCIVTILFYLFLFYFNFFKISGSLIGSRQAYETKTVQIRAFSTDSLPNINYTLVTKTPTQTNQQFYNTTLPVLRDQYRCVLNDYSVQSNVNNVIKSSAFVAYQVFGFLFAIFHILIVSITIARLDICKAFSLCDFEQKKYHPLINYGFIILAIFSLTSLHYLMYGGLYHLRLEPCLGKSTLPGLEFLMKNWVSSWVLRFVWAYIGIAIAYTVIIFFLIKPLKTLHPYIYIGLLVLYFMGVGIRGFGKSYSAHENAFGLCGQLLGIIIAICLFIVDLLFICFSRHKPQTIAQNNIDTRSIQDFNRTEEFFFGNTGLEDQFNQK